MDQTQHPCDRAICYIVLFFGQVSTTQLGLLDSFGSFKNLSPIYPMSQDSYLRDWQRINTKNTATTCVIPKGFLRDKQDTVSPFKVQFLKKKGRAFITFGYFFHQISNLSSSSTMGFIGIFLVLSLTISTGKYTFLICPLHNKLVLCEWFDPFCGEKKKKLSPPPLGGCIDIVFLCSWGIKMLLVCDHTVKPQRLP